MILHPADGMSNSYDAINHRPGVRPDMRMVGDSVVVEMPVLGVLIAEAPVRLVLRFDPDGEVFAALDCCRIERSKR
jgi:hypothetical protein